MLVWVNTPHSRASRRDPGADPAVGGRHDECTPGPPGGYAQRIIGTLRRELPYRLLIVNELHLRRVLTEYLRHYNTASRLARLGRRLAAGVKRRTRVGAWLRALARSVVVDIRVSGRSPVPGSLAGLAGHSEQRGEAVNHHVAALGLGDELGRDQIVAAGHLARAALRPDRHDDGRS